MPIGIIFSMVKKKISASGRTPPPTSGLGFLFRHPLDHHLKCLCILPLALHQGFGWVRVKLDKVLKYA